MIDSWSDLSQTHFDAKLRLYDAKLDSFIDSLSALSHEVADLTRLVIPKAELMTDIGNGNGTRGLSKQVIDERGDTADDSGRLFSGSSVHAADKQGLHADLTVLFEWHREIERLASHYSV